MTRQQAETSKARGERFVRTVLKDDEHADALADENLEDWAKRKRIRLTNPRRVSPIIHERKNEMAKAAGESKADLLERIKELEEENEELQDELDQVADIVAPYEDEDEEEGDDENGDDGD